MLTKSDIFIIGPVATVLGLLMNAIFVLLNGVMGVQNIGVCIIIFTIVIYMILTPITIKQQKFSKMSALMNPEIQKIQKKYAGKKDQVSMTKMQEETQAVYTKYGVSPMGTCLPMLVQMPILFALYRVIWNIPAYVSSVKEAFFPLVENMISTAGTQDFLTGIVGNQVNFEKLGYTTNTAIDALYKFKPADWLSFADQFPGLSGLITQTSDHLDKMNYFLGMNISNSPWNAIRENFSAGNYLMLIVALLIPVLAGLTQWLNVKLMPQADNGNSAANQDNTMANSMKTMNTMMPLMSVFFCFTLPIGLGIYWIMGAVIRSVQQVVINRQMNKLDVDELLKKNLEKANEKRAKQGLPPQRISDQAKANVRNIESPKSNTSKSQMTEEERRKKIESSTEYYNNSSAKAGSIASKARMVEKYNEKNKK